MEQRGIRFGRPFAGFDLVADVLTGPVDLVFGYPATLNMLHGVALGQSTMGEGIVFLGTSSATAVPGSVLNVTGMQFCSNGGSTNIFYNGGPGGGIAMHIANAEIDSSACPTPGTDVTDVALAAVGTVSVLNSILTAQGTGTSFNLVSGAYAFDLGGPNTVSGGAGILAGSGALFGSASITGTLQTASKITPSTGLGHHGRGRQWRLGRFRRFARRIFHDHGRGRAHARSHDRDRISHAFLAGASLYRAADRRHRRFLGSHANHAAHRHRDHAHLAGHAHGRPNVSFFGELPMIERTKRRILLGIVAWICLPAAFAIVQAQSWNEPVTGRGNTGVPANVAFSGKNLAGNVSIGINTITPIDSVTLSALPAGCGTNGCRLRVTYSYFLAGGTQGMCWATDGTSLWDQSYGGTVSGNFSFCNMSSSSPGQYSAGATPTVTVDTVDAGTVTACATTNTGSPCNSGPTAQPTVASYLQVEVVQSN